MSPTSRATWLNPTNLARGVMLPLSPAPCSVATAGRGCAPLELWQDGLRHSLKAVDVVSLQPLQHDPLDAGPVQAAQLLDDLWRGADDVSPGAELVCRLASEL